MPRSKIIKFSFYIPRKFHIFAQLLNIAIFIGKRKANLISCKFISDLKLLQSGMRFDFYMQKSIGIKDYLAHFTTQKEQIGVIVFVDEQLAGFDFFNKIDIYEEMHEKIMKSHILEAMASTKNELEFIIPSEAAQDLLNKLGDILWQSFKAVSLGSEWRAKTKILSTAALVSEEEVVHWTGYGGRRH